MSGGKGLSLEKNMDFRYTRKGTTYIRRSWHISMFNQQKVLIATSVTAEQKAIQAGLGRDAQVDVMTIGVGPMSAAAYTAKALASKDYDLVISMGIAGGFKEKAAVESLVVADALIAADLGAESSDGFLPLDDLGFGSIYLRPDQEMVEQVVSTLFAAYPFVHQGAILTRATVTGTEQTASRLIKRYPDAVAEAMEGFGVGTAAKAFGVPFLEIRSISNEVGPRNREAWKLKESLSLLTKVSSVLWRDYT